MPSNHPDIGPEELSTYPTDLPTLPVVLPPFIVPNPLSRPSPDDNHISNKSDGKEERIPVETVISNTVTSAGSPSSKWGGDGGCCNQHLFVSSSVGQAGVAVADSCSSSDDDLALKMAEHKPHLERLVKLQLNDRDQPPKAPLVSSAGLWGLVPPRLPVRFEHPNSFFSGIKQPGVVDIDELMNPMCRGNPSSLFHVNHQKVEKHDGENPVNLSDGEIFPALFSWIHGGNKVSLTGSFTDWSVSSAIPMIKSTGRHFSCIVYLPRGIHRYKFIVDDKVWHYCPRQMQEVDRRGNVNNVLNMSDFDPDNLNRLSAYQQVYGTFLYPEEPWNQTIPESQDMSADCPTASSILLDALSGVSQELQDLSGYSAVLKHAIIKRNNSIGKGDSECKHMANDVIAVVINLPCEHSNTGSPDPRLTAVTLYSRLDPELGNYAPNMDKLPLLFEEEDTTAVSSTDSSLLGSPRPFPSTCLDAKSVDRSQPLCSRSVDETFSREEPEAYMMIGQWTEFDSDD